MRRSSRPRARSSGAVDADGASWFALRHYFRSSRLFVAEGKRSGQPRTLTYRHSRLARMHALSLVAHPGVAQAVRCSVQCRAALHGAVLAPCQQGRASRAVLLGMLATNIHCIDVARAIGG